MMKFWIIVCLLVCLGEISIGKSVDAIQPKDELDKEGWSNLTTFLKIMNRGGFGVCLLR